MHGTLSLLAAALVLAAGMSLTASGMTIQKRRPVPGQAGTKTCDLVRWIDANGKEREIALVCADGDGKFTGGYVTRYSYYIGDTKKTGVAWDSAQQGVSGMGCAVNHYAKTATTSKRGKNATTGFLFEGDHHCVWRWKGTMSMGGDVDAQIYWIVADGRSDILWAVSYDSSRVADNKVQADARGPYFQFDWDGCGKFYGATISGIRWGDTHAFETTTYARDKSAWSYAKPNTIPYMLLYKDASLGDVECGVVQTQPWTIQDAGGYWWSKNWGKTGTGMPENWNCPYQLNAYEGYGGEKMAWGTNYGYVGNSKYDVLGYKRKSSGYPHQGYAVSIILNRHSEGLTDATIGSYEAVQKTRLTASSGSVVTSGPDHAGLAGDVAYHPAGWDHISGQWAATCEAGRGATVNLAVARGRLARPVFRFAKFTASSPGMVRLNGAGLRPGTDYYTSVDAKADVLYLTLNKTLRGQTNTLSVGGASSSMSRR